MVFIPPEIVVFSKTGFGGSQRRFNVDIRNLDWYVMGRLPGFPEDTLFTWDDKIKSVIIISGIWQFFTHADFITPQSNEVKPGTYSRVDIPEFNIAQESISSFRVIDYNQQDDSFVWL